MSNTLSHTTQFKNNPATFLDSFVVIADSTKATGAVAATTKKFYIKYESKNVCTLRFAADDATDFIEAYWLPWKQSDQTSMLLGAAAEFFFTSEMSNCRFSVLAEGTTPRVAHIAGNEGQRSKRNEYEKTAMASVSKDDLKKVRRLSVSQGLKHGYFGSDAMTAEDKSSAFVFGRRQPDNTWKFYAQIAKGFMDGTILAKPLVNNVAIVKACMEI